MQRSPLGTSALNDPGDETQRNYRYQHAYGVILLIGAATSELPYNAVYAEHHEDYLCERIDGKFDGYQVKTRKPEEGLWDLSDEPIKKSIKRFVNLYQLFGDAIYEFKFVSNSDYSHPKVDIKDTAKLRKSPTRICCHSNISVCRRNCLPLTQRQGITHTANNNSCDPCRWSWCGIWIE